MCLYFELEFSDELEEKRLELDEMKDPKAILAFEMNENQLFSMQIFI